MKIGMPALIEYNTIEENIDLCKELNLSFIELNMNFPYNMINNVDPIYLSNLSQSNNIEFTMHMPDYADIASFYEDVGQGYLKLFIDTIKWAENANIKLINMHIDKGAYMTLQDKKVYINEKYSEVYTTRFLNSIKIISDLAYKHNVIVCIENVSNFEFNYVQEILDKALNYKNIYLTWDVGHDYLSDFSDSKILLKYKDKIKHMHLHDAKNGKDHLVLKEGELNIDEYIRFVKNQNLSMLIEVKSKEALVKSIQNILN